MIEQEGHLSIGFADAPDDYLLIEIKSHFSNANKEASVPTEDDSITSYRLNTKNSASVGTSKKVNKR